MFVSVSWKRNAKNQKKIKHFHLVVRKIFSYLVAKILQEKTNQLSGVEQRNINNLSSEQNIKVKKKKKKSVKLKIQTGPQRKQKIRIQN